MFNWIDSYNTWNLHYSLTLSTFSVRSLIYNKKYQSIISSIGCKLRLRLFHTLLSLKNCIVFNDMVTVVLEEFFFPFNRCSQQHLWLDNTEDSFEGCFRHKTEGHLWFHLLNHCIGVVFFFDIIHFFIDFLINFRRILFTFARFLVALWVGIC